jgi:TRAP-type C4-dicarboxylate transport system substrate-binding protein
MAATAMVALLISGLWAPFGSSAFAAEFTMKLATPTPGGNQNVWMAKFKARVEARAKGRLEVRLFPSSQLGAIPRMIEGLQTGAVEGWVAPAFFMSGLEKRNAVMAAAGLFDSMDHCRKVANDPKFQALVSPLIEAKNIVTVATVCSAPQAILTKKKIRSLDDFKGLKIRVLASPFEIKPLAANGINPTPMPLGEVMPSFQRGVIDGVSSIPFIFHIFKMHTVGKTITMTRLGYFTFAAYVSKLWFDKLPPDLQAIVKEEAAAAIPEVNAWNIKANAGVREKWKKNGGRFVELSDADKAKFKSRSIAATRKLLDGDADLAAFHKQLLAIADAHR